MDFLKKTLELAVFTAKFVAQRASFEPVARAEKFMLASLYEDLPVNIPKEFAKKTGVYAGKDYIFPKGEKASDIEAYLSRELNNYEKARIYYPQAINDKSRQYYKHILDNWPRIDGEMKQVLSDIIDLNPSLKELRIDRDDTHQAFVTLIGITTGFNVDDINAFVNGQLSNEKKTYQELFNGLQKDLGGEFAGWFPCNETLLDIYAQAVEKGKPITQTTVEACRKFCQEFGCEMPVDKEFGELREKTNNGQSFQRSNGLATQYLDMRKEGKLPEPLAIFK